MWRIAALAMLVGLAAGCGPDGGRAPDEKTAEPFREAKSCAELRCPHACVPDDVGMRCECEPGEFGIDCHRCPEGEQDYDGDGICHPDCASSGLDCGTGVCDDFQDVARCICPLGAEGERCEHCTFGWQDHDGDGMCLVSCALAEIACRHGACDDTSGRALCVCEPDWTGDRCDACAEGLQDLDLDGVCLPDCATAALACGHGECVDASGQALCACFAGWEGDACDRCRDGLSDEDGDGVCTKAG